MNSRRDAGRIMNEGSVLVAVFTLGFFLVLFKLVKVGFGYTRDSSAHQVVIGSLLLVGTVLAAALISARVITYVRRRRSVMTLRWSKLWVIGVFSIVAVEFGIYLRVGVAKFFVFRLLGTFAQDIAFVAGLAVLSLVLVRILRSAGALGACLLSATLLLIATLEFLFFLKSGTRANWYLLLLAVGRFDEAGPAIQQELGYADMFLVGFPLTVLAIMVVVSRKQLDLLRKLIAKGNPCQPIFVVGVLAALFAVLFPLRLLPDLYRSNAGNVFLSIPWLTVTNSGPANGTIVVPDPPTYSTGLRAVRSAEVEPLNVVIFILESVRAFSAPPHQGQILVMPFLDSLSRRAYATDRMYTTVPATFDALVSIFGGVHPPTTWKAYFEEVKVLSWPALLGSLGYRTVFFTSGFLDSSPGVKAMLAGFGFQESFDGYSLAADSAAFETSNTSFFSTYGGYEDRVLVRPVLDWVDTVVARNEPFLVSILTHSSHHPYLLAPDVPITDYSVKDPSLNQYLNSLRYLDSVLSEIMIGFDRRGLSESTVFVFVGDHGQAFGEHGVKYHINHVWEETIRVPFVVYVPSIPTFSGSFGGSLQQTDIMPILLNLLKIELRAESGLLDVPFNLNGHSKLYVSALASQAMALITDSLKYVYDLSQQRMKVYDLATDPYETIDIAPSIEDDVANAVKRELLVWQRKVNATHQ